MISTAIVVIGLLTITPDTLLSDHIIVQQAIYDCKNVKNVDAVDRMLLHELLDMERAYGVPNALRGMSLAAACNESGFNPDAKGDWRFDKHNKRRSKAHGLMQLWPWFASHYGIDRLDPRQNADAWLKHIAVRYTVIKDKQLCPRHWSDTRKWVAAWVQTTRGRVNKENRYRCYQRPSHLRILRRWQRAIQGR